MTNRVKQSGLYMILNGITGRCYVGSTNDKRCRLAYHRYLLKNNKHSNKHLQGGWNKYGEENFHFIWLINLPVDQLLAAEQKLLDINTDGYNIAKDSQAFSRGLKWTEERKAAARALHLGKKMPPEFGAKISAIQKGIPKGPQTPEHIAAVVEARKGVTWKRKKPVSDSERENKRQAALGNQHWLGKKHTPETIEKLKIAAKKRGVSQACRDASRLAHLGKKLTPEQNAAFHAGKKGSKHTAETIAKMKAAKQLWWSEKKTAETMATHIHNLQNQWKQRVSEKIAI